MPEAMQVVTIMNFDAADLPSLRMCKIWMDGVQRHAPHATVTVLHARPLHAGLRRYFESFGNVRCERATYDPRARVLRSPKAMHNIYFKLYQLAARSEPFLYLDADIAVLENLEPLWERRHDRPWIGIDHQRHIPGHTGALAFLNSGVQIVGDPDFYDYERILACARKHEFQFQVPGTDQGCLWTYFRSIGYDYTHPAIGSEWNACAGYVRLFRDVAGRWRGQVDGLTPEHPVHINHYWHEFKPWRVGCPLYEAARPGCDEILSG